MPASRTRFGALAAARLPGLGIPRRRLGERDYLEGGDHLLCVAGGYRRAIETDSGRPRSTAVVAAYKGMGTLSVRPGGSFRPHLGGSVAGSIEK
jgi:hypothetical protein